MLDREALAGLVRAPVPRYTSYPTAPHFSSRFGASDYAEGLAGLRDDARLSLYLHVPFCDTLCWFCGCHTKVTQRYAPVANFLETLRAELPLVAGHLPKGVKVAQMHWGGGSPTMLSPDDITRLLYAVHYAFWFESRPEFAIEVDPRGLEAARIAALAKGGLTRVSIGVQDFDPLVQQAINRVQSFEETRRVADSFRLHGVRSLNIDALYGLPHQTEARLERTLAQVVSLKPDRIALFGYAHVPWMKKHQTRIPEAALPDIETRYRHAEQAAAQLEAEGYERIGIDHFALAHDAMAIAARTGALRRNFQGYTVDPANALIGFGPSAISALPGFYAQNRTATARYAEAVRQGVLPIERGIRLTDEDRLRRFAIERILCRLALSADDLEAFGAKGELLDELAGEIEATLREDRHGLVERLGSGFRVTERGRPFLRVLAARFDAYLAQNLARHSVAV